VANPNSTVAVIVYNRFGASEAQCLGLRTKSSTPISATPSDSFVIRPRLYVLAIGVGTFKDASTTRLKYPGKDAKDFVAEMLKQKGVLYADVQVKLLTDSGAGRAEIMDGLEWIQKQTTQHDVAMVFLSGHGESESADTYYYLPYDAKKDRLRASAVSFAEIRTTFQALAGKTLFFVDTCHAANAMGNVSVRDASGDINGIVNDLSKAENGAVVFAACTGKQYAQEKDAWGNGAFTKAILEGLDGKAARSANGKITVNMLDLYVTDRVKELTSGTQTPATRRPNTVPDFPIAIAPRGK